jgi:hypothetical protein
MGESNSMKRSALFSAILCAMFALFSRSPALAESGAGPEAMSMGNMCMVMFGYDMIHITAYLPGQSRSEYCEEIPSTGNIIMVFDIENPKFRDLPLEIRIIRDPLTPIAADTNLDPLTIVHFPPTLYKKGTFSFAQDYASRGHYIGLVTLTKENGERETQMYKFSVGETLWQYVPFILGAVLIAMLSFFYWRHSHTGAPKAKAGASA